MDLVSNFAAAGDANQVLSTVESVTLPPKFGESEATRGTHSAILSSELSAVVASAERAERTECVQKARNVARVGVSMQPKTSTALRRKLLVKIVCNDAEKIIRKPQNSKFCRNRPDVSQSIRMRPNAPQQVQAHGNGSECKTSKKLTKMFENLMKTLKTFTKSWQFFFNSSVVLPCVFS